MAIEFQYDERRHLATAIIRGREVRLRGSREAAQRFFAGLEKSADERGLLYTAPTAANVGRDTLRLPRR